MCTFVFIMVFGEKLQSLGTVGEFTRGMEQIEELVRNYAPEKVAAITGVNPEDLKTLVKDFCAADSASCYGRVGVSTQKYGSLSQWLINVFNIVTGNRDGLARVLAEHDEVDAVWHFGSAESCAEVERASAGNLKRVWTDRGLDRDWYDPRQGEGQEFLRQATHVKNVWIPYGE